MMSSDPIFLTDRTSIETDWSCGMKLWWYKYEGGMGISPSSEAKYFLDGRELHEDAHRLAEQQDDYQDWARARCEEILQGAKQGDPDQVRLESATRRAGWLAANALFVEPGIRAEFENLSLETEIVLDRDPLWIATTPDRVLRRRSNGALVIKDYKSFKSRFPVWDYSAQLQILIKAVEEEYGAKVEYAQIMGFDKGQDRYGRLTHPYVWAYTTTESVPLWTTHYKYGLTHTPVWEYHGGIFEWVKELGPEAAEAIFPHSRPIFLNERLLEDLIRARVKRETEIYAVREACQGDRELRTEFFEPRYSSCRPLFGSPCPYLEACHNAQVNTDPIGSGLYTVRVPHHELEIISQEGEE